MAKKTNTVQIQLVEPVIRGEGEGRQVIETVTLRKPGSGELRGIKLLDLVQMDVRALTTVLPRITEPALTEEEARRLDIADILDAGTELSAFFSKDGSPSG